MTQHQVENREARGCCEGIDKLTPLPVANRPGLDALRYRVGTHSAFLETMQARLTDLYLELEEGGEKKRPRPLRALTTREADDPAIALLDAWATVGDVLTFYQERIANEGYLRTATERRSILELARLIGYELRPGVAASVYLAFTLEEGHRVEIPAGTRAQSLPGPGEARQAFETSEPLRARAEWNMLKPRTFRPQLISKADAKAVSTIYLDGTETNLAPNDPLLLSFGPERSNQVFRRVRSVDAKMAEGRTEVTLQEAPAMMIDALAVAVPEVRHIVDRYLKLEEHEVAGTAMAERVAEELEALKALPDDAGFADIRRSVGDVLEKLQPEHETALEGGYTNLEPWLNALIKDLEHVAAEGPTSTAPVGISETPIPDEGHEKEIGELPQVVGLDDLIPSLVTPPSLQPANAHRLSRSIERAFAPQSDTGPSLLTTLQPQLRRTLYAAWANAKVTQDPPLQSIEALRVKAAPFGHNAPLQPEYDDGHFKGYKEWDMASLEDIEGEGTASLPEWRRPILFLDAEYDEIISESWLVIERPPKTFWEQPQVFKVKDVRTISRADYGISRKVTRLTLDRDWLNEDDTSLSALREVTVYAQGEELASAEEPMDHIDVAKATIELDGLCDGLDPGRWLIVSGERTDIPGTEGVMANELVMVAGVIQGVQEVKVAQEADEQSDQPGEKKEEKPQALPGDRPHTTLQLVTDLAYTYKRDTVTIYGNVVKATHGETREEVLGSGDGSQARQQFELKTSPLTYLSAPTPSGAESTLEVRVNDVRWHDAHNLFELEPLDRGYVTHTDNEDNVTVMFGDGAHGARLPTGIENVRAVYRKGIGKPGNVDGEQISMLATRPLGVKGVVNPLPASGGADRESRDQARRNAPLAVMALDRLVSVRDYADFARTFAGIGKASAVELSDGRREVVHLTIAGADDIPIEPTSDLYQNLRRALLKLGDPYQPLQIDVRELKLLVISARVRLLPDYAWESVAPEIRATLLDTFSFQRRELGQDVVRGEVISAIQHVPGVAYVDLDILDSVQEDITPEELENLADTLTGEEQPRERVIVEMARIPRDKQPPQDAASPEEHIKTAQIAYLSPDVPDTLMLQEL